MPGQKYLIWQTPWEHEWEMLANLWKGLPACRGNSLLHDTALSSPGHPTLLKAPSHSLFKPKLLSGRSWGEGAADRQATGTWDTNSSGRNRDVLPRMSAVKAPAEAWSRQRRSCCCRLIVYLKCAREKCSIKFAEIWIEIQNLMSVNHSWFESLTRTQKPWVSSWIYSLPLPASASSSQWEGS